MAGKGKLPTDPIAIRLNAIKAHDKTPITDALRVLLSQRVDGDGDQVGIPKGSRRSVRVAAVLLRNTLGGDNVALRMLLERVEGMVAQKVEQTSVSTVEHKIMLTNINDQLARLSRVEPMTIEQPAPTLTNIE